MSTAVTIISLDYKMTAMLEPSLLSSTTRPPFSANAPSMADTLPSISFGFEDLRDRMAHFTDRFDVFIAKGRKRVLEERNQFRITVAELHGNTLVCRLNKSLFYQLGLAVVAQMLNLI